MCLHFELTELLDKTKKGLFAIFDEKLQNILLYGSYARGDQDQESDIDVLALLDLSTKEIEGYEDIVLDLAVDIGSHYNVLLSILLQDMETFVRYQKALPFFQNVVREGISLVR